MSEERTERTARDCEAEDLVDRPLSEPIHAVRRRLCLLVPLDSARGLSLTLVQLLAEELPELELCLRPRAGVGAIWLCGYELGHDASVRALRRDHPDGVLLVTGRAPREAWEREVLQAGADHVSAWPAQVREVARILGSERVAARRSTSG